MPTRRRRNYAPRNHHIDRRAAQIVAADNGAEDELLDTAVSPLDSACRRVLTIARSKGYAQVSDTFSALRQIQARRSFEMV